MDAIATILTSSNSIIVLSFLVVIIVLLAYLAKKGIVSFNGHGVKLGDSISSASRIKQLQWDILQAETEIALRKLPKEYLEEPKKWRTHYVVGKYRDVLQQAILMNNIVPDQEYIESKQVLAYSAILKATVDDYFKTEEFKEYAYKLTENIIKQFCKIKHKYEE